MQRELVIVNQDVGYLFVDLANCATQQYDKVILITGSVVELGSPLNKLIEVVRISQYRRSSFLSRLTSWLLGFIQILFLLAMRYRKSDVLLSSNPPLNSFIPLFFRKRNFGLYVLDLYPEALHMTGMISQNNFLVRLWSSLNSRAYRRFSVIWALTPSMKRAIETYGVTVAHAPAWASDFVNHVSLDFLERVGLRDRWIVLYSGNLGREHELECLLDSAAGLTDHDDLVFVIAGEGWKKKILQDRIVAEGIKNVRLLPKLSGSDYEALLRASKIAVVSQSMRTADVCIPSKTFNVLSRGKPVLGIGNPDSDFGRLINGSLAGKVYLPTQGEKIIAFILKCRNEKNSLGSYEVNARQAGDCFTKKNAETVILSLVKDQASTHHV